MDANLDKVQTFLTQIDEDDAAKEKFAALAQENDLAGFEKWAEDSGCDLDTLRALATPPEGELSDDDLESVAGGAGWLLRSTGSLKPLARTAKVDGLRSLLSRVGARWPRVDSRGIPLVNRPQ